MELHQLRLVKQMDVRKTLRQWWWHQTDDLRTAVKVFVGIMVLVAIICIITMALVIR